MADKQVIEFIKNHLEKGVSRSDIEKALVDQGGWSQMDVSSAFLDLEQEKNISQTPTFNSENNTAQGSAGSFSANPAQENSFAKEDSVNASGFAGNNINTGSINEPVAQPSVAEPQQDFSANQNSVNSTGFQEPKIESPSFSDFGDRFAKKEPLKVQSEAPVETPQVAQTFSQENNQTNQQPIFTNPVSEQPKPIENNFAFQSQPAGQVQQPANVAPPQPEVAQVTNNQNFAYNPEPKKGNRIGSIVLRIIQIASLVVLVVASFQIPLTETFAEELRLAMTVNIFLVPVLAIAGFFDAHGLKKINRFKSRRFALILSWLLLGVGAYFLINLVGLLELFGFVI